MISPNLNPLCLLVIYIYIFFTRFKNKFRGQLAMVLFFVPKPNWHTHRNYYCIFFFLRTNMCVFVGDAWVAIIYILHTISADHIETRCFPLTIQNTRIYYVYDQCQGQLHDKFYIRMYKRSISVRNVSHYARNRRR